MNILHEWVEKKGFGQYPPEYDKRIHGRYDPARYYGKPDTPLREVKIGELSAWLGRRNKSPRAMVQAISRAWWRYQHRYWLPKRSSMAGFYQYFFCTSALFYVLNYPKKRYHQQFRYH